MDIQKSTDINMDIHDFWMSSSILHTSVDIHVDIQAKYPYKDILQWIRKQQTSMN